MLGKVFPSRQSALEGEGEGEGVGLDLGLQNLAT